MAEQIDIYALVRIAKIKNPPNPLQFLKDLLVALYDAGDIPSGKVLVSSSEGDGTVTFSLPPGVHTTGNHAAR